MNLQLPYLSKSLCTLAVLLLSLLWNPNIQAQETIVQRVRLNFTAPDGAVRQILLGFTSDNSATDGFDYGWDAINWDNFENDLNWMIGSTRCIIQGVGSFENTKTYPFGMFIGQTGEVRISLHNLENFDEDIPVYIHDTLENTYTQINDSDFLQIIETGSYTDRFYITFDSPLINNNSLSDSDFKLLEPSIRYNIATNEILVDSNESLQLQNLRVFDMSGKQIFQKAFQDTSTIKTYFKNHSNGNYIVSIETDRGVFSKILLF